MRFVVTLIADPQKTSLRPDLLGAVTALLSGLGAVSDAPDWLDPGQACDIAFDQAEPARLAAALSAILAGHPIDFGVQAATARRKKLLVADMDATIVTCETLDELAAQAGLKTEIAAITRRAMAGELDFPGALRQRLRLLSGLPVEALERTLARLELTAGARTLVRTMKANGAYSALLSGGFRQFTERVQSRTGFDETHANRLVIRDGALTGEAAAPILDQDAKLRIMNRIAAARGLKRQDICSVGDGANDAPMLAAAGLGVAFRGKAPARDAAKACIDHADLTALLYLQGYRRREFSA